MKFIAVAGGTASGKSNFSKYLAQKLEDAVVISLDNYYLNKPESVPMEKYNFDIPTAFDFKSFHKDLETLQSRAPIQMPQYQYGVGARSEQKLKILPKEYIIIEGLYVLMHASIRSMLTYSFFLESPPDVVVARRVERDIRERHATLEYSIYQYFQYSRPAYYNYVLPTKQYASMVVTNDYQSRLDLFIDDFLSKYML